MTEVTDDFADPSAGAAPDAARAVNSSDAAVSADELQALRAKAAEAESHWDHYLRAKADLDNYRKRVAREREEAARYAQLPLMEKLLPALDNLELALAATQTSGTSGVEALRSGVSMVAQQIKATLAERGLQEIDAVGQPFDPQFHEAISQQESTEVPEGHVLHQVRKGYRLHERLVRPASVVVARKPGT